MSGQTKVIGGFVLLIFIACTSMIPLIGQMQGWELLQLRGEESDGSLYSRVVEYFHAEHPKSNNFSYHMLSTTALQHFPNVIFDVDIL